MDETIADGSAAARRAYAAIPDTLLEGLALAPLPASALRLVMYLARRTRGSDATGGSAVVAVSTKLLCRLLDLTHASVRSALKTLSDAGIVSAVPGDDSTYGLALNADVSTWGRGKASWVSFHQRLEFERMAETFLPAQPPETLGPRPGRRPAVNVRARAKPRTR